MKKIFLLGLVVFWSCGVQKPLNDQSAENTKAKNVILLVGDGMGLTQITAGIYMNNNQSNIERFPIVGLHKCHSYDNLITDSAAGATAFASGIKTFNGAIGVNQDTLPAVTILEEGESVGMVTGLVASASITHATPASFAAHNKSRGNMEEIAADMVDSGVDLMIGGGKSYFDSRTIDNRNLSRELAEKGVLVTDYTKSGIDEVNIDQKVKQWVHLTADKEPGTYQEGRDYLVPASKRAITFLEERASDRGFFLMIEGSQIDWAGHANNFPYMVEEFLEFDRVIKEVLDFAEKDGNTLVILTADHETGGLAINSGSKMNEIVPAFTTGSHTGTMIPVFAYGPGAELFSGIYENNQIYHKMKQALGLNVNN